MNDKKTAVILGASGLVGNELLTYVLANSDYQKIRILVRNSLDIKHPKLEQKVIDFDRLAEYGQEFQADDVFCCLGTTIKKAKSRDAFRKVDYEYPIVAAKLATDAGAKQYLVITSMGADPGSKVFYSRVKGETEEALRSLGIPKLHIFRPSLLLGDRKEFRFGERMAAVFGKVFENAMLGRLKKYRPIYAGTVAIAMYRVAQSQQAADDADSHTYVYSSDQILDWGLSRK